MHSLIPKMVGLGFALLLLASRCPEVLAAEESQPAPLVMVVMDPLAAPLACPCVKGYAQRDYEKLARHLERAVNRKVKVVFDESLETALKNEAAHRADIVIGKKSVVEHDAQATKLPLEPVASLTDLQGVTTQTGLIVVRADAPVQSMSELADFRILFGPKDCDEKHTAALASLKANGVDAPETLETSDSCSDGAALVVEAGPEGKLAAVISSYAKPLLEGCGTIKKGDLRVVGETAEVPFIEAFVSGTLAEGERTALRGALLAVKDDILLCKAIESRDGFVLAPAAKQPVDENAKQRPALPSVSKKN